MEKPNIIVNNNNNNNSKILKKIPDPKNSNYR